MLSLAVLVVLALLGVTHGGPSFPDVNTLPMHQRMHICLPGPKPVNKRPLPNRPPLPYEVVVSGVGNDGYEPGKKVTVQLKGKAATDTFNDFFIWVESESKVPLTDPTKYGTWEAVPGQVNTKVEIYCPIQMMQMQFPGTKGITAVTDTTHVNSVQVTWKPSITVPPSTIDDVTFKAAVVKGSGFHIVSSTIVKANVNYTTVQQGILEGMKTSSPVMHNSLTFLENARKKEGGIGGMMQQLMSNGPVAGMAGGAGGMGGGLFGGSPGAMFGGGGGGGLFSNIFNTGGPGSSAAGGPGSSAAVPQFDNLMRGFQSVMDQFGGGAAGGWNQQTNQAPTGPAQSTSQNTQSTGQNRQTGTSGGNPFNFQLPPMPQMPPMPTAWNQGGAPGGIMGQLAQQFGQGR